MASGEFAREAIFAIAGATPFFLAAAFLAWKLWRRAQERDNGPRVIAEEVRRYIDEALRSSGFETLSAGRDALDGVNRCLGPFVEFADGFGGKITQLKVAVAGTIKDDGEGSHHPHDGGAPASSSASAAGGTASASASVGGAQITVTAPAKRERQATTREHIRRVRNALEALGEYWVVDNVTPKLKRMQGLLLKRRSDDVGPAPRSDTPYPSARPMTGGSAYKRLTDRSRPLDFDGAEASDPSPQADTVGEAPLEH